MRPGAALTLAIMLSARVLVLQPDASSCGVRCQSPPQSIEAPALKPALLLAGWGNTG
jgi:hypothetical protein